MGFSLSGSGIREFPAGRNHYSTLFIYQQAMDFSRGMGKNPRRRRNSMTSNPIPSMIPSILEERGGVIWFPCAAWECGVDASHPALLGGIASLTHALRVKNGLRRMGTHSGLRRRQLLTCDAQESNWMRRILNCIPMRRMGTRWQMLS